MTTPAVARCCRKLPRTCRACRVVSSISSTVSPCRAEHRCNSALLQILCFAVLCRALPCFVVLRRVSRLIAVRAVTAKPCIAVKCRDLPCVRCRACPCVAVRCQALPSIAVAVHSDALRAECIVHATTGAEQVLGVGSRDTCQDLTVRVVMSATAATVPQHHCSSFSHYAAI